MNKSLKEKKNIFEHIADNIGTKKTKDLFSDEKKSTFGFEELKNIIISFCIYAALGLIIGTICDIVLGIGYLSIVLALVFIIIWILKKFGNYLH